MHDHDRSNRRLALALILAVALGGCTVIDRGPDGSPRMARLPDGAAAAPPPALSAKERQQLDAENARILREQEAAITAERRAAYRAYAYRAYPYPYVAYPAYPAYVMPYVGGVGFYGHWGSRGRHRGGVGVSIGYPGYYWGPGWW
ncbi:hypothetical protein MW7_001410 [Imbroritus primus]|uniref:Uncharacterized protein n=1 Tax=Imbroritus primus TaxID=3058603 RepID=A0ACD3ST98_9BURK|nr:hypothetical protein MW7_001410 [Burkholderiaceae bacterium PBA]